MDVILKVALVVATIYVGLVAAMYLFQRKMMYFPAQTLPPPAAVGAPDLRQIVLRTEDGLEIVAWRKAAARPDAAEVLYFHGNGGNIASRVHKVRPLLDAGHGVTLLSWRGYGGNPGEPGEQGLYADARAAYLSLVAEGVAAGRIALIGESLGSGVAVHLASERQVGAVMLEAPFTSTVAVGQKAYPFVPVGLLMKDRYDSLSRIGRVEAPLLVVHGDADRVVPVAFGRELFAAAGEPKEAHFLPGAGHGDLDDHGLMDLELDFLARHVGGRR
jgi:hypothetical protein